jgi:hypothetical protein
MHWNVNESTLIKNILPNGLLSSKKEVETSYGETSRDDGSNTQNRSPHLLVSVIVVRLKSRTFV